VPSLAQLKDSLATWAGDSTELTALELQGIAQLQSEFVAEQLRLALPVGARNAVRTVEISPQFAQSVVTTDPTQINVVALSDDLFAAVQGAPQTFSLTAAQVPRSLCPMVKWSARHFVVLPLIKLSGSIKSCGKVC
jgi:hypothetical protein